MSSPPSAPPDPGFLLAQIVFVAVATGFALPAAAAETLTARVDVEHANTDRALAGTTVLLRAARPTGPLERERPDPQREWSAETDASGTAVFDSIPTGVASEQLELTAVVTYGGITYRSSPKPAADGAELQVRVYDKQPTADGVRIERLRTVVEPWEDYLVFTQFWHLTGPPDRAVDTSLVENDSGENGLPIRFPTDAEGIEAEGPGETEVIDATLFWRGTLTPNRSRRLRVRFSMSADASDFVFRQAVDYPTDEVEAVFPIQTNYDKHPRLHEASMTAPGFETVEHTTRIRGLKRGVEYLYASGRSLEAGDEVAFRIGGLPFGRPLGPWLALGLGIAGAIGIGGYARRRFTREDGSDRGSDADELRDEYDALIDELADLERARERGDVDEVDYEVESLRLRERLAMLKEKLDGLDTDPDA